MANPVIAGVAYPNPTTIVLITATSPPGTITLEYRGSAPVDPTSVLQQGLQNIADAITAQTTMLRADDERFLKNEATMMAAAGKTPA